MSGLNLWQIVWTGKRFFLAFRKIVGFLLTVNYDFIKMVKIWGSLKNVVLLFRNKQFLKWSTTTSAG